MKANAPERIWIDLATDLPKLSGHIDKDCVEYTCTDVFIVKAWDWIENNILSPNQQDESFLYYEQFKNDMKGE